MKKWPWIVLAAVIVLLGSAAAWFFLTDWTVTVGISGSDMAREEGLFLQQQLPQKLQQQELEVLFEDCHGDQAKQLEQLLQLTDRTAQVLVVSPAMADAGQELLQTLHQCHVPVVLTGRAPAAELEQLASCCYVGFDNTQPGSLQVDAMTRLPDGGDLNGDGVVSCLILQGPEELVNEIACVEGCKKALKLMKLDGYVLEISAGSVDSGYQRCDQLLRAYGKDAEVILCTQAQLALGAAKAARECGLEPGKDIYLFSGTYEPALEEALADGSICAAVDQPRQALLQALYDAVMAFLQGQVEQPDVILPHELIFGKNLS